MRSTAMGRWTRRCRGRRAALVDELDLWVTMTDLDGLQLPIDLDGQRRLEQAQRGRSTSATARRTRPADAQRLRAPVRPVPRVRRAVHVVVPVRVRADAARRRRLGGQGGAVRRPLPRRGGAGCLDWVPFFDEIVRSRSARAPELAKPSLYRSESFGDGGYLDNKPFTWATATLTRRRADLPVDRRLIYIEPDPSGLAPQFHDKPPPAQPPWHPTSTRVGVIPNVIAAAHSLPRAETIREDIERLLERNREIARIRGIADLVDDLDLTRPLSAEEWSSKSSEALPGGRDPRYAAYHRLKVDVALDALSDLVSRVVGIETDSEYASALRCVLQAWFDATYSDLPSGAPDLTEAEFLLRYDASYRLRRLTYLDGRIERLLRFDDRSLAYLTRFAGDAEPRGRHRAPARARCGAAEREAAVEQGLHRAARQPRTPLAGRRARDALSRRRTDARRPDCDPGRRPWAGRVHPPRRRFDAAAGLDDEAERGGAQGRRKGVEASDRRRGRRQSRPRSHRRRRRSDGEGDRLGGRQPRAGVLRGLRLRAPADGLPRGRRSRSRRGDPDQPAGCRQPHRRERSGRP